MTTHCTECGTKLETDCGGELYCWNCDDKAARERAADMRAKRPSVMDQQRECERTGRLDGGPRGRQWIDR
jgi:uncharacterized Zn finger protein (UPF0148 family)